MKKIFALLFVFTLFFSAGSTSFANTISSGEDAEDTKMDKVPISPEIQSQLLKKSNQDGSQIVTVTDESELERIASERGLEEVPIKIEYEYNYEETDTEDTVFPYAAGKVCYVKHMGSEWYNRNTDLYKVFRIDGPDTFKISQTIKRKATYSGNFGASKSVLEASFGFQIGKEYSITFASNTPISASQRAVFNLFTTYKKVMYAVENKTSCAIGYAYQPNGTYIEKLFYNK